MCMRKYLVIILLLLSAIFHACKDALKTELRKAPVQNPIQSSQQKEINPLKLNLPKPDPYYADSTGTSSKYGPANITRSVLQDSKGNIWLATWEGIIRYDPKAESEEERFVNLTNREGLRPFRVFSLLEDSKGNIWFGTIGAGVYMYDGKSFTNLTTEDGLVFDGIGCIYEDNNGNIWFGTQAGLSCYDGKSFRNFTTSDGLTDGDINSIIQDKSGLFWFGTRGYACTYDGTSFTKFTDDEGKAFVNVRSIIEDKNGDIWLGGNDGLWRHCKSPQPIKSKFVQYTENFTGYIFEDSKGNIWTSSATNGPNIWSVSRYDKNSIDSESPVYTEINSKQNMFFGIMEDDQGDLWFGHLRGVTRYDGSSFESFRK